MLATGEVKCIDEEVPFEIPQGWEWCRLGELISYQNGYAYTSSELNKEGKGLPVIKSGNLMTYEVVLKPNNDYVENSSTKMLASAIKKGDLLMCLSSQSDNPEPLGKTAIYKANNTALLNQRVLKMRPWLEDMLEYMYYVINSEYFHYTVSHQGGGSAQANLKLGHVLSMLIPLAPLKEEIRIVDKINTIMPLVHQYETTFLKQKKLNSELNDRLKSAILQEAIQGNLVPQINEEGTAQELLEQIKAEKEKLVKEGKLKKSALNDSVIFRGDDNKYWEKNGKNVVCIDAEIPFEVPSSWIWCRMGDCVSIIGGYAFKSYDLKSSLGIRVIRISDISEKGLVNKNIVKYNGNEDLTQYLIKRNDILIAMTGGTVGKSLLLTEKLSEPLLLNQRVAIIRNIWINVEYLNAFLHSPYIKQIIDKKKNSTNDNISMSDLNGFLIPLPPLKEQYRIVERYKNVTSIMSK